MKIKIKKYKINEWKERIDNNITGLYYFYIDKEIVYIGKAKNIRQRLLHHFSDDKYKKAADS